MLCFTHYTRFIRDQQSGISGAVSVWHDEQADDNNTHCYHMRYIYICTFSPHCFVTCNLLNYSNACAFPAYIFRNTGVYYESEYKGLLYIEQENKRCYHITK